MNNPILYPDVQAEVTHSKLDILAKITGDELELIIEKDLHEFRTYLRF